MDTVFASLVAVAGTLIGSLSTYLFQRRTTERSEARAREERVRQERLAAYSGYAGAVTDLKRAQITLWFRRRAVPRDEERFAEALLESDRHGAAAETAAFRLRLVADDRDLRPLMEAISAKLGEITHADDRRGLIAIEAQFEEAVGAFLDAAASRLG
uniref:Secreted protein n=1 Tax=Streptomyces sp. NBC_00049 TaxID=2903617 RepID=A0AAU2JUE0_9ACTN